MAFETLTPQYRPGLPLFFATILFGFTVGVLSLEARAQTCGVNAQSPIATDRPQVTNSSVVVPCGSLQFENGFQVTGTGGQRSLDFPETSVRFGIAAKTELRVSAPNYLRNDASASGANGFGDVSLGLKQQLGPIHGFDISLIPSLSLPAGAKSISSNGYDPTVQLPWSRSMTKAWTVAGQFGVTWPTEAGRHTSSGQTSLYVDRQLTSPWDIYLEYSGTFPQHGGPQHLIDFGTAFKSTPHQQFDIHCGVGLSSAAPDYSIGFGYSVRFRVIRSN